MDMDFKLAQESGIHTPDAVGFMPFKEVDGKIQLDLETFKFDRTETPTRNYERRQRRRK